MKKHYACLLQLISFVFFAIIPTATYAKSNSILDPEHPLYEIEWMFVKTLFDAAVYRTLDVILPPGSSGIFLSSVIIDSGPGNENFDLFSPTDTTGDTAYYDYQN